MMQFADEQEPEKWAEALEEEGDHGLAKYLCGGDADHYGDEIAFPQIEVRCSRCGFVTFDNEAAYIHGQGDCSPEGEDPS